MKLYAILLKQDGADRHRMIKTISLSNHCFLKIETADNAEEALFFDTQERVCYVLDMLVSLDPSLQVAPIVVEAKDKAKEC